MAAAAQPNGNGNGHTRQPALRLDTINPSVLDVAYAVRGELALRADKYAHQIADAAAAPVGNGTGSAQANGNGHATAKLPFDKVVTANIGNPQQAGLDQRPITFWRQVISLLEYPALMEEHIEIAKQIYPSDAIARAKSLYKEIGSVGAYTHSKGALAIRKRVAKFIEGEPLTMFMMRC